MKCWYCNSEVIWNCDYDFEDFGYDGSGIVTMLTCSNENCKADYEISLKNMEEL